MCRSALITHARYTTSRHTQHEIVRVEQFTVLLRTHMQMMIGDWIGTINTIAVMCALENA